MYKVDEFRAILPLVFYIPIGFSNEIQGAFTSANDLSLNQNCIKSGQNIPNNFYECKKVDKIYFRISNFRNGLPCGISQQN